jgi:hypothetical protein
MILRQARHRGVQSGGVDSDPRRPCSLHQQIRPWQTLLCDVLPSRCWLLLLLLLLLLSMPPAAGAADIP